MSTSPAAPSSPTSAKKQAWRYLQASLIGTLANFFSRFPLTELIGFGASVIVANYIGMALVFLLSYRRAFAVRRADWGMVGRFALVAHTGLAGVWAVSVLCLTLLRTFLPASLDPQTTAALLEALGLGSAAAVLDPAWIPRLMEGACHATGIVAGFGINFWGHRWYSFRKR